MKLMILKRGSRYGLSSKRLSINKEARWLNLFLCAGEWEVSPPSSFIIQSYPILVRLYLILFTSLKYHKARSYGIWVHGMTMNYHVVRWWDGHATLKRRGRTLPR